MKKTPLSYIENFQAFKKNIKSLFQNDLMFFSAAIGQNIFRPLQHTILFSSGQPF